MTKNFLVIIIGVYLFISCQSNQKTSKHNEPKSSEITFSSSFKPQIKYAQYFTIQVIEKNKVIVIKNPWKKGDTLASYFLYTKDSMKLSDQSAEFRIPVPIEKVVVTSSPHIGFIGLMGELDKIVGVANDRYIFNSYVYDKVNKDKIVQVGSLKDSNLEVLLDLSPDIVMKTGIDNVRNEDIRLTDAKIPISYNVEWMENNMLARAEWIKFVGAFFNRDAEADSIFNNIESEYLKALTLTKNIDKRPEVMTGNNFKGTWYMPSSDSYLNKLIQDGGGEYKYKNKKSTGSIPLSFEVVLNYMAEADFWIGPRARSLKELEMMDERYTLFKAFRDGNVYTFNKRMSKNGGNDYWESGMTRPDLILKDIIKIFHPNLLPNYQLYYYKKLN